MCGDRLFVSFGSQLQVLEHLSAIKSQCGCTGNVIWPMIHWNKKKRSTQREMQDTSATVECNGVSTFRYIGLNGLLERI